MPHDRLLPQPGEVWRHWKGGLYEVVCLAIDEALGRTMVVYAPVWSDEPVWVRTLFSWMQVVAIGKDRSEPRFSPAISEYLPAIAPGSAQDATEEVMVPSATSSQPSDVYA